MRATVAVIAFLLTLSSCYKQHYGCKCYQVTDPNNYTIQEIGKMTNPKATAQCKSMEDDLNKNSSIPIHCETGITDN